MLLASDARQLTNDAKTDVLDKELEKIEALIKEAASEAKSSIMLMVSETAIIRLQNRGFKVIRICSHPDLRTADVEISW